MTTTSGSEASRTSEQASEDLGNEETRRLREGIEQTRADMSSTITALETRLSPTELKSTVEFEIQHVEERVRVVVKEQLTEAKEAVQAELVEAKRLLKEGLNDAEEKVRRGLSDAKQAVKQDVSEAVSNAKSAVRAATLGKVEDLATDIGDKMNQTRETLVETVRNNPLPAAVMGVGLVWLLMNRSKSVGSGGSYRSGGGYDDGRSSYGGGGGGGRFLDEARERAGNMASGVGDAVGRAKSAVSGAAHQVSDAATRGIHDASDAAGSALHGVTETASQLAHRASDTASHWAEGAGDTASSLAQGAKRSAIRAEQSLESTMRENPMAVGAAALAIGAVVGFSLPRTEREDALMGGTRDQMLRKAGEAAHDAASSVSHLAENALEGVKKSAQELSSGASA